MQQAKVTGPRPGPEGYILAVALLLPLALMWLVVSQVADISFGQPTTPAYADDGQRLATGRPAPLRSTPPPTLVPPTATPTAQPAPTAAPAAAAAAPTSAPTPEASRSYKVQPGDELKHIAAEYGVSIWKIIDANDIHNPDSLRVGQVLEIPDN